MIEKEIDIFKSYVSQFDMSIPSIHLKYIHTLEVVKCMEYLCEKEGLSHEETYLALLIALLHDIARFPQYTKYQTFQDSLSFDHGEMAVNILFDTGLIRDFIKDESYDDIIRSSLYEHNKYKITKDYDSYTLQFIHLIRNADKLDNYRVKRDETIETLLGESQKEVENECISESVYTQFKNCVLIYAPTRHTKLDFWLSYIAFMFDLNYVSSLEYLKENHCIEDAFDRITPKNKETYIQYLELKRTALKYLERSSF